MMIYTAAKHNGRYFFKCRKCKKCWARDLEVNSDMPYANPQEPEYWRPCPHCGFDPVTEHDSKGRRIWNYSAYPARMHIPMGKVDTARIRLMRPEYRSPCDGRCTNARGPSCECKCGGENHGTGRLVTAWRDSGPVPALEGGAAC